MKLTWSRAGRPARRVRWPRRRAARLAAAAAGVLVACGVAIPPAFADYGGLVFDGCIGGYPGCTATDPAGALGRATGIAVSGSDVYAATGYGVAHLHADTAGNLAFAGCTGSYPGCSPVGVPGAVGDSLGLVVGNGQLYVVSQSGATVAHFTLGQAGNPVWDSCVGDLAGCTPPWPARALQGAQSLAMTPDGRQLYVGSAAGVSHYTIGSAGNLTFAGCIGNLAGCTTPYPGDVAAMAVTPDGRNLYASAFENNEVVHYLINPAGDLIYAGCIGNLAGCTATYPRNALDGPAGLAVTPDGAHLYAAAKGLYGGGNAVSHFTIDPAGNLIYAGCIGDLAGCTPTYPAGALDGASTLAVDPITPAMDLYAAGGRAITHFVIDRHGNLIFDGCIGYLAGCTPTSPGGVFTDTLGMAINNAGTSLYATGLGNAVSHFIIAGFTTARPSTAPTLPPGTAR